MLRDTQDKILSIGISLYFLAWALTGLFTSVDGLMRLIPHYMGILSLFRTAVMVICYIVIILQKKIKLLFLIFGGFVITIFAVSAINRPDLTIYLGETFNHFVAKFAIAFIIVYIKNVSYIFKYLFRCSVIYFIFLILFLYNLYCNNTLILFTNTLVGDCMLFSYTMLPFDCCLLYDTFKSKSTLKKIMFFVNLIIMIVWGCRGAIVSVCCYAIVLILRHYILKKRYIDLLMISLVLIVSLMLIVFYLGDLNHFLNKELGIKSYSLTKLTNVSPSNTRTFTSGRSVLYKKNINDFEENYGFKGINADKSILNKNYSHNFFLEVMYNFGWLLGSFIVLITICFLFNTIFCKKNGSRDDLLIYFGVVAFTKLMFSNTFLDESFFYLWIALYTTKFKFKEKYIALTQQNLSVNLLEETKCYKEIHNMPLIINK